MCNHLACLYLPNLCCKIMFNTQLTHYIHTIMSCTSMTGDFYENIFWDKVFLAWVFNFFTLVKHLVLSFIWYIQCRLGNSLIFLLFCFKIFQNFYIFFFVCTLYYFHPINSHLTQPQMHKNICLQGFLKVCFKNKRVLILPYWNCPIFWKSLEFE